MNGFPLKKRVDTGSPPMTYRYPDGVIRNTAYAVLISILLHFLVGILALRGGKVERERDAPDSITARLVVSLPISSLSLTGPTVPPPPKAGDKPGEAAPVTDGQGGLPVPGIKFYPSEELSKRPHPLAEVVLETPETQAVIGSGKIRLTLWIDHLGNVFRVELNESELPELITQSAIKAFGEARFEPGEKNMKRVGSIMRIEVSYDDYR